MTDVGKIQGPSGPPENLGKKDKASADADKFKQAMRRKVTEVSKVDPDEQKKRKRREEAEDDEDLEGAQQGPATPANQVTPFSLEQEKKKITPLEMQKGGPGISPTESAQPTRPSPPTTSFFQAPSPSEMEDDSGVLEEESFIEKIPSQGKAMPPRTSFGAQAPSTPPEQQAAPAYQPSPQPQPQKAAPTPPQGQKPFAAGPPGSAQQPTNQVGPPQQKEKHLPGITPKPADSDAMKQQQQKKTAAMQPGPSPIQKEKEGLTAASLEGTHPSKVQDTSAFFEQMGKDGKREGEKGKRTRPPEKLEEEAEVQGAAGTTAPPGFIQSLEGKEETKVKEKEQRSGASGLAQVTPEMPGAPQLASPPPPETLPPYANLHPQVMELFDRMAGVMTVMTMSGITETTITLNSPQFASSVFFGTQIIIQEFSTAPKAFNIQLNGNPQAVALIQGNADDLMAAFQAGNYNFRVNRLETGYLSERPLFKRKEKAAKKDQDQTGENP